MSNEVNITLRKVLIIAWIITIYSLIGCEHLTEEIIISKYPDCIIYFAGYDTELDLSGGEIEFLMSNGTTSEPSSMELFLNRITHDIDFNTPGVYIIIINNYNNHNAEFAIQVVDEGYI